MKRTTTIASIALIASSAFAGAAAAGSLEDTTVEAPVFTPAPTPTLVMKQAPSLVWASHIKSQTVTPSVAKCCSTNSMT